MSRNLKTPEYRTWCHMKRRCYNPKDPRFQHYGGRGIRVCDRWRVSFARFLLDMGPRPTTRHSLDRIDNDRDYGPGNCRWSTQRTQQRNRSNNHRLCVAGFELTLAEWGERGGISPSLIKDRLARGWAAEEAVALPVKREGAYRYRRCAPERVKADLEAYAKGLRR